MLLEDWSCIHRYDNDENRLSEKQYSLNGADMITGPSKSLGFVAKKAYVWTLRWPLLE